MATFFSIKALSRRNLIRNILLLIPGIAGHFIIQMGLIHHPTLSTILNRADIIYIVIISLMIFNSLLMLFSDAYSHSDKSRNRPLKGLIQAAQVALVFLGGIICIAVIIGKSPAVLLTGLGASAAVLMLVFKDSILGLVAGVQLAQNKMIEIGDWIQMPDGSANGTIEEMTLITVKVRNWDNTISTIPPYTLVSSSFINWRGMMESGGRRVDKMIRLDINSVEICTQDMIGDICKNIPLMADYRYDKDYDLPTNSQLYRIYIKKYLDHHPLVSHDLDLIIAQREANEFGLPVEVYFFITDKVWDEFERIQSDIFDHLIAMTAEFGLKPYQLPTT